MEVNFEQTHQRLNELTPELARLRLELGQSQRENETARVELSRLTAEKDREVRIQALYRLILSFEGSNVTYYNDKWVCRNMTLGPSNYIIVLLLLDKSWL